MANPEKFVAIPNEELPVDRAALRRSFVDHILHTQGRHPSAATDFDQYIGAARTTRDRMADRWTRTWHQVVVNQPKRVYYLSMEYLLGRLLEDGLHNLGIHEPMKQALADVGLDLEHVATNELDPGLGNGGLGRLAACFLDSMATLGIAGTGYGIRYEFGIFRQDIVDGAQVETPDNWLRRINPWEVARHERSFKVHFNGRVIRYTGEGGQIVSEWVDTDEVLAMAYDVPVPGYKNGVVNTLRLWSAKAARDFDIHIFNRGHYLQSVEERCYSENISRVLYPNDSTPAGQELRLKQEYFLVSATLQDAVRRHLGSHPDLYNLAEQAVFQLNDTHPALAVPELMRLLIDEHGMLWENAWAICRKCMNYTNHTVLPEALEHWPVYLFERLLPRHLEIIYQINFNFLAEVRAKHEHYRRGPYQESENGQLGDCRQLARQWRIETPQSNSQASIVPRFRGNGAREGHQCHQWGYSSSLAAQMQSRTKQSDQQINRTGLGTGSRPPRTAGPARDRPGFSNRMARSEATKQAAASAILAGKIRHHD